MTILPNGDLQLDNGTVVPVEKRTRTLVYSRPVGYLSPVENWNPGKRAEFLDRAMFDVRVAKERKDAQKRP
jgi:hypothetical protein